MKVWRGNGKEFAAYEKYSCGFRLDGKHLSKREMEALGFELVETEPVEFELVADSAFGRAHYIADSRLRPGKRYRVVEVVE